MEDGTEINEDGTEIKQYYKVEQRIILGNLIVLSRTNIPSAYFVDQSSSSWLE